MADKLFKIAMISVALGFTLVFCFVVLPPLVDNPDVIGALASGFVNPYAAGYSADVIFCWFALAALVVYEAKVLAVKYGWVCLVLGLMPGVAVGLALYFIVRSAQVHQVGRNA